MNIFTNVVSCICILTITYAIHSYPLFVTSNLNNLAPFQIDRICSLQKNSVDYKTLTSETPKKRFAMPFPDMNRFLSTSHRLHRHKSSSMSGTTASNKKHDFHAYLCSISKDSEEMSNFLNIFVEEYGQHPAFNILESCEQVVKRDELKLNNNENNSLESVIRLNQLSQFCSNRSRSSFTKRWEHTVEGPISIDFIHQMLESRKVQSYPYPAEIDPYLVGR
ncbi:unnamed protein product [Rotaria magnacalcarata]|uniref:Uncharacterized protein n=1 Tax=Rotaria magnacalcarata TaxID=392030 RepID=A0A814Y4Q8_9BILA|nr:unnamed protein product [Rotaria magnacalcarata]CAF1684427.1 unnamed protein product [Rotaria magnacalcarata]CAF2090618.1 unnamed protein product [Rotaria magnacalcarata]